MRDISAKTLFQSLLQGTLLSSFGMGRYVHFLMLSIQHILCRQWCGPPSKMPSKMVLERPLWRMTCLNHTSFCILVQYEGIKPTRNSFCTCTPCQHHTKTKAYYFHQQNRYIDQYFQMIKAASIKETPQKQLQQKNSSSTSCPLPPEHAYIRGFSLFLLF